MGLFSDFVPKHARRFVDLGASITAASREYLEQVQSGSFPAEGKSL